MTKVRFQATGTMVIDDELIEQEIRYGGHKNITNAINETAKELLLTCRNDKYSDKWELPTFNIKVEEI